MRKAHIIIIMFLFVIALCLPGCNNIRNVTENKIMGTNIYAAKDDLDRELPLAGAKDIPAFNPNKQVGIFYFLSHGAKQVPGPYDVSKIIEKDKDAAKSNSTWLEAGGGNVGSNHWWGEPLFGYFRYTDRWVKDKDIQMLTDAGVDFVVFDYSNGNSYNDSVFLFIEILEQYHQQGFKVPKIAFVTKEESVRHMAEIYRDIYKAHPEYEHLWFKVNGKPLIIGNNKGDVSEEVKNSFTIRFAQWPRQEYHDDGFPWIDFTRPQQLYGKENGPTVMSVSVAQHSGTLAFSSSAFYGDETNKTRSYHNGSNDKSERAYLYGYNFAEQFEYAIEVSPDIIFVTGWNEWVATRINPGSWTDINGLPNSDPIILVDTADIENSRDIQPMRGGYGDNYYMQLISYIRKFKGIDAPNIKYVNDEKRNGAVNFENEFNDWNNLGATYYDYIGDTLHRDNRGYGREVYINNTGRNDILICKTAVNDDYIYFYVETKDSLTPKEDKHWMSLFLHTNNSDKTWFGYDYVINRISPSDNEAVLEKNNGGWNWTETSKVKFMTEGNKLQIAVPLAQLGYKSAEDIEIHFKWTDNYQEVDNNVVDFFSFYLDGDTAPYGRLNYIFTN